MSDNSQVATMVSKLAEKKDTFLNEVEHSINKYIASKSSSECLTLVERYSWGEVKSTWEPSASEEYVKRLWYFIREKDYKGYKLDSKLTDGVVELVTKSFEKFYADNAETLAKPLLKQLTEDKVFAEQLARQIVEESKGTLPTALKDQLAQQLVDILENSLQNHLSQTALIGIKTVLGKVIAAAVALPISKAMVAILLKNMAILLKGIIAKIMATTTVKTVLMATIKKIAATKIVAALAGMIALGSSVSVFWIVAPLIIAFILYEVANLPQNMAEKVSSAVKEELSGEFDKLNTNVVSEIVKSFTATSLNTLIADVAKGLVADENFRRAFDALEKN